MDYIEAHYKAAYLIAIVLVLAYWEVRSWAQSRQLAGLPPDLQARAEAAVKAIEMTATAVIKARAGDLPGAIASGEQAAEDAAEVVAPAPK